MIQDTIMYQRRALDRVRVHTVYIVIEVWTDEEESNGNLFMTAFLMRKTVLKMVLLVREPA